MKINIFFSGYHILISYVIIAFSLFQTQQQLKDGYFYVVINSFIAASIILLVKYTPLNGY